MSAPEDADAGLALLRHELRAPLTSIGGWVEILLDGALGELAAEQVRAVEVIGRNVDRLSALVAELGTAEEAAAGHQVDLVAVVAAAVDLVRPTAWLGEVLLRHVPADGPARVVGDAPRLERAVVNVLGNAVKYTPAGGSVTVRTSDEDGVVVLEVVDTGMGVPTDDVAHLTRARFRAANAAASAVDGDGLGLALVRDVVEAHGGEVLVASVEGSGTTVVLRLPGMSPPAPGV